MNIEVLDDAMVRVLRGMTGSQRLEVANRMWIAMAEMINRQLALENPDWAEARVQAETALTLLETPTEFMPRLNLRDFLPAESFDSRN